MAVFGGIGVFTQAGLVRNPVNPAVGSPFGVVPATPSVSSLILGPTIIRSTGPFTYSDAITFGVATDSGSAGVFSVSPTISLAVSPLVAALKTILVPDFLFDPTTTFSLPAQLTLSRASSGRYFDSSGVMQTATANTPRFDYKYNGTSWVAAGLLVEEQRTNYATNQDFTTWTIQNSATTITSGATAIDGTTNAYTLTPNNASTTTRGIYNNSGAVTSASPMCHSVYVKANGYTQFTLRESGTTASAAVFTLTGSGSVFATWGNGGVTVTASIFSLGGGWYRAAAIFTPSSSITTQVGIAVLDGSYSGSGDPFGTSFTADLTSGAIVCFPQNEVGTEASSYIPVTGSAGVVRSADIISSTDAGLLAEQGWIIETGELRASNQATLIGINTGVGIGKTSGNAVQTTDGGTQTTGNTATWTGNVRAGIAWDSTPRVSIDLNGGTVVTAANTPATPTALYFGNLNNGASDFITGHIRVIAGYSAVTDAQLATLSTVGASTSIIISGDTLGGAGNYTNTAAINLSPVSAAATFAALVGAGSGGVVSGISPGSNINALNLTSIATATSLSPTGLLLLQSTAVLALTEATTAIGNESMQASASVPVHTVIASSSINTMTSSATLTTSTAITPAGNLLMNALASLAVHPAMSSTGGNDFTQAISFAVATTLVGTVAASITGLISFGDTTGLTASVVNRINANAALAVANGIAPASTNIMNASVSLADSYGQASTGGADYLQSITLAATQAVTSSVKLAASGTAALSATITELVQSTAFMSAVSSVATQAGVSAAGALNIITTAALASSPRVGITGGLFVNGAIGFNQNVASNSSVQYKLNPQLSFQAAYNSTASNVLLSSDEIELAAQLFVLSLLESDHPLATLLYAKGVWQDTLSLKGILDSIKEIKGVVN